MSQVAKFLTVVRINCRELKKCQKVPLNALDLKGSSEWNPQEPLCDNFLALTADSNQREVQPSPSNSSADGTKKPHLIEVDSDQRKIFKDVFTEYFCKNVDVKLLNVFVKKTPS